MARYKQPIYGETTAQRERAMRETKRRLRETLEDTPERKRAKLVEQARETLANPQEYDFFSTTGNSFYSAHKLLDAAQKRNADFMERFNKNPHDAMQWSVEVFESAAMCKVVSSCIAAHERGHSDAVILDDLKRQIKYYRPRLSRSTNPVANLMEDAEQLALQDVAEQLSACINYYANAVAIVYAADEGL